MPRSARSCPGGYTYQVLNRGNARTTVFHKDNRTKLPWLVLLRQVARCVVPQPSGR